MSAGPKLTEALQQGRALTAQRRQEQLKRLARAVENVLDGSCESAEDAARGQGVSVAAVNAAVRKARGL